MTYHKVNRLRLFQNMYGSNSGGNRVIDWLTPRFVISGQIARLLLLASPIFRPPFGPFVDIYLRNSLKLECEKLASEKMEIQRHYVMVKKSTCVCIDAWYSLANYRAAEKAWVWVWIWGKNPLSSSACFLLLQRCIWNFLHV